MYAIVNRKKLRLIKFRKTIYSIAILLGATRRCLMEPGDSGEREKTAEK